MFVQAPSPTPDPWVPHRVDSVIYDTEYDTISSVRVVLDTNVLVAGLRSRRGASFQILSMVGRGRFESVVSVPLVLQYEAVLKAHANALGLTLDEIDAVVGYICGASSRHEVFFRWRPSLRDPEDELVLEAAVAGRCGAVVTHNVRDFIRADRFGIEVLTPAAFLRELRRSR